MALSTTEVMFLQTSFEKEGLNANALCQRELEKF
jgi:hypothetical protein